MTGAEQYKYGDLWSLGEELNQTSEGSGCENEVLPSGFEPESKPREGFMIGRYTTGAF